MRFRSGQCTFQAELSRGPFDAVSRVNVFNQSNLVASSGTLARDDRGVCEEELPDLWTGLVLFHLDGVALQSAYSEPSVAILGLHLLSVRHPVSIPPPQGSRVVDADGIDPFDLEAGTLKLVDEPSQRRRSVGAREDVLVHEQTPDEVLILPGFTQSSNLEEEHSVVVEHVIDLG